MRYNYNPNGELEKFAVGVYNLISEKFSQTYFVGGVVRDLLLHRKIADIDIATEALPKQIISLLQDNQIDFDEQGKQFGVITAKQGDWAVEITTFRAEKYEESRFPKVGFIRSAQEDSRRRDFTINALYFDFKNAEIIDYHEGLKDLENKVLRFIGDAEKRIEQDPLRIVRAYRFQLSLNFNFDQQTQLALQNSHQLIKTLSQQRIDNEINKVTDDVVRQKLLEVIHKNT